MRILFMGTPEFAVPSLRALVEEGHDLVAVATRPDRPRRSSASRPGPSPVKVEAGRLGLPLQQPDSVRSAAFLDVVRAAAPETIVVVAFGKILPPGLIDLPPRWCINLHASLLPAYRGAAPIARAIIAGETRTGLTTMRMDRGLDTGDILMRRECNIGREETAGELTARLAVLGAGLLIETLQAHSSAALRPSPQDHARASLAPPLDREDGSLDWSDTARALTNRIRGCNPWPLAAAGLRGQRIQILRAREAIEEGLPTGPGAAGPGTVLPPGQVALASGERLVVACGGGTLLSVLEMRFPGRRAVMARDALNGRLVGAGDRFTPPPV
ncbi:MAG TPA: methionyl-tRNA formyltransferase [Candidatus Cryosericum sp.]|nr:methionyl-tRNA formyltransferase [Candidatus Cryosericum sp.]